MYLSVYVLGYLHTWTPTYLDTVFSICIRTLVGAKVNRLSPHPPLQCVAKWNIHSTLGVANHLFAFHFLTPGFRCSATHQLV